MELLIVLLCLIIILITGPQNPYLGTSFTVFLLTLGAVETAVLVSLTISYYRLKGSISINNMGLLVKISK